MQRTQRTAWKGLRARIFLEKPSGFVETVSPQIAAGLAVIVS
jgi:hypothetical protein